MTTRHKQGLPVRIEKVLYPHPCALQIAALFGRQIPVLTERSVWRLGEKVATTYGGFYGPAR